MDYVPKRGGNDNLHVIGIGLATRQFGRSIHNIVTKKKEAGIDIVTVEQQRLTRARAVYNKQTELTLKSQFGHL